MPCKTAFGRRSGFASLKFFHIARQCLAASRQGRSSIDGLGSDTTENEIATKNTETHAAHSVAAHAVARAGDKPYQSSVFGRRDPKGRYLGIACLYEKASSNLHGGPQGGAFFR